MAFCSKCGADIGENAICPECGQANIQAIKEESEKQSEETVKIAAEEKPSNRKAQLDGIRKNLRGERGWYIAGGILAIIAAILYLFIGIGLRSYFDYSKETMAFTVELFLFCALFIVHAIVSFVYAGKLKKYSRELDESLLLERCTSPAPIIIGFFFNFVGMIYAIIIFSKARGLQ